MLEEKTQTYRGCTNAMEETGMASTEKIKNLERGSALLSVTTQERRNQITGTQSIAVNKEVIYINNIKIYGY